MNAIIVGASAGLGRALAEALARQKHQLLLVASDARDLDAIAADLRLRFDVRVETLACRITAGTDWLDRIATAAAPLHPIDALFFPIGLSRDDDHGTLPAHAARDLLEANLHSVLLTTAHFLPGILQRGHGHIVGFGSVAAVRGRGANVVYAAAKKALVSYFESLRHLTAGTPVRVQLYQLGYLDTQQAFGKKLPFPKADPTRVATYVVDHLSTDFGLRYFPRFWSPIATAVQRIPWPLYKNMKF
jgi:short-subunit dehydrogenase